MGGPHDRFGVASVTRATALACLERACTLLGINPKSEALQLDEHSREELLPIEQLMAFAHENGILVLPIRFDWVRLSSALAKRPVLLVLKNRNVIAAEKLSTSEEIILFDPLAPADERFLVARSELEPVWDGDALTVESAIANRERPRMRVIALTAAFAALIAPLVILFALNDSALVTNLFPSASSSSLPAERLAPSVTSSAGKDIPVNLINNASAQADISEFHGSNAREQTRLENGPGALRSPEVSNSAVATSTHKEQELASKTNLSGMKTDQSNPEHQAPIANKERSDQNESLFTTEKAPELPQEHPVERQHASSAPGDDQSFEPQALTSSGSEPATAPAFPSVEVPLDASRPMTTSEWVVKSPSPSLDKSEGVSDAAKAPDSAGRPGLAKLTSDQVKTLIARGDLMLGSGDLTSARLFYERAANAPDAQAALRLGESYDPAFLASAHLRRTTGNVALAAQWYQRAAELGAPEADTLLRALEATIGVSR